MTTPPPDEEPTPISFEKALPEEPEDEGEAQKKKRPDRGDAAESGVDVAADAGIEAASTGVRKSGNSCDGCDVPGCDCNLLLRLSTLLSIAALLVPRNAGSVVSALLRGYRRWLTRFTPRCPSTPSCSAFAVAAVESMGPRRGLAAAARRVRDCR